MFCVLLWDSQLSVAIRVNRGEAQENRLLYSQVLDVELSHAVRDHTGKVSRELGQPSRVWTQRQGTLLEVSVDCTRKAWGDFIVFSVSRSQSGWVGR